MYTQINLKEFKEVLKPEIGWKYTVPEGSKEYAASFQLPGEVWVRVWTSIAAGNVSRACGKDAIRVVMYQNYDGKYLPIKKFPIVTRQQNWARILEARVLEAMKYEATEFCPKCGAVMTLRKPRRKQTWQPFLGCVRFPQCKGSKQISRQD